jgi:hypothetical protein
MPRPTPHEELARIIYDLHDNFSDAENVAGNLIIIGHELDDQTGSILFQGADYIEGMHKRVRELKRLLPKLMAR